MLLLSVSPTSMAEARAAERNDDMAKEVLLRLDDHRDMTLRELEEIIQRLKEEHPDMDIFLDGDERAICGRPKKPF